MKCPKCNGRGTVGYFHIDHFVDIECDRCNGSGEVPMTNEEWIRQANTEQLAEWLVFKRKLLRIPETNYEVWIQWLKEKHNESV